MKRIKRFVMDDSATAEASSIIILIAAAGILLAVGVALYFNAANDFFNSAGATVDGYAAKVPH